MRVNGKVSDMNAVRSLLADGTYHPLHNYC